MNKKTITILILAIIAGGFWYTNNQNNVILNSFQNLNKDTQESQKSENQNNVIPEKSGIQNEQNSETISQNNQDNIEKSTRVFKNDNSIADYEKNIILNWKTYRNNYYGYQINYPSDWGIYIEDDAHKLNSANRITLYITKDCDDYESNRKKMCPNKVEIIAHQITGVCDRVAKKNNDIAQNGRINKSVQEAFQRIFDVAKDKDLENQLQYNDTTKNTGNFIFENKAFGNYLFITKSNPETCFKIRIQDGTNNWKYLTTEKMILESFKFINEK